MTSQHRTTWADAVIRALELAASGWLPLLRVTLLVAAVAAAWWLIRH